LGAKQIPATELFAVSDDRYPYRVARLYEGEETPKEIWCSDLEEALIYFSRMGFADVILD
jgi:hypothetical protein